MDYRGNTPLKVAVTFGNHDEVIKILGNYNNTGDIYKPNVIGNNCYHSAAENNDLKMLKILLNGECYDFEAFLNGITRKNNYGQTVLHVAAHGLVDSELEDWNVIELLIDFYDIDALADMVDNDNQTVRDIFLEKGWSYADHYDKLIQQIKTRRVEHDAENKKRDYYFNVCENDINKFESIVDDDDKMKQYVEEYMVKYELQNLEQVYSLLLIGSIAFKNISVVVKILSENHGNILTAIDHTGYSAISRTLYCGNEEILYKVQNYIDLFIRNNNELKKPCLLADCKHISAVMRYPQFDSISFSKDYYLNMLGPLYTDTSLIMQELDCLCDD